MNCTICQDRGLVTRLKHQTAFPIGDPPFTPFNETETVPCSHCEIGLMKADPGYATIRLKIAQHKKEGN